jgi:hypothetical protein
MNREAVARALLELIGKGPGSTFPFPEEDYQKALYVVDLLTEVSDG